MITDSRHKKSSLLFLIPIFNKSSKLEFNSRIYVRKITQPLEYPDFDSGRSQRPFGPHPSDFRDTFQKILFDLLIQLFVLPKAWTSS